jgi:mono/diheme cytochrome c family protein
LPSLAAALVLVLGAAAVIAQDRARTVRDGVFSPQQAARGERVFESICMSCHDLDEFTGRGAYLDSVEGDSLWEAFDYISDAMPEDDPGSLPQADYAAVLAYLFSAYGLPSGATELPTDRAALEALAIVRPAQPGS